MPAFKPNPTGWGWNGTNGKLSRGKYKNVHSAEWYKPELMGQIDKMFSEYPDEVREYITDNVKRTITEKELAPEVKKSLDAELEKEFKNWLMGKSRYNNNIYLSDNLKVKREVMDVFHTEENQNNPRFDPRGNFHKFAHTHWGTQPLVDLPGVRDYIADDDTKLRDEQLKLAKLAHFVDLLQRVCEGGRIRQGQGGIQPK